MRIGIFGGSFDPIHLGHLWIAESAREHLGLDQVRWIPASVSPLKTGQLSASERQRLEMMELAIGGYDPFVIDDRELKRGGVSYTIDTLRSLHVDYPSAEFFLILGADSLNDFEKWKEPQEICKLAIPAVVARGGSAPPDWNLLSSMMEPARLALAQEASLKVPLIEISSRDLRARCLQGKSIRYRVPRGVEAYIRAQGLYASNQRDG